MFDSSLKSQYRIVTGGQVSVAAKLKPRRSGKLLTVGDRFDLELVVRRHRNVKASEPFCPGIEPFAAINRRTVTRYAGDTIVDIHTLTLAPFSTGDLAVPRFIVSYPQDTLVLAAASETIPLKVASVLPEGMKDINDLKPQIQFPNLLPLWIALGIVVAGVLTFLGYRLYRRYRRIRLYGTPLPDPWDEALAALEAIPVDDWLGAGLVKKYYYAVSEILKRYLTRRFDFPALDQTTTEIIRTMKVRKVDGRDRFGDFFQRADMVKYAKHVPPVSETEAVVPAARDLVRATIPEPVSVVRNQKSETRDQKPETRKASL